MNKNFTGKVLTKQYYETLSSPSRGDDRYRVSSTEIREDISCAKRTDMNLSLFTSHFSREGKRYAFTLAEVLITLGIIGVVAALTLPSVIEKHQKQVTLNKLKKVYSTLSQFVVRTSADNGAASDFLSSGEILTAEKTKEFFETFWLPYFNAPMLVNENEPIYNMNNPYIDINGNSVARGIITQYDAGRIVFSVQDGIIYNVSVMIWEKDTEDNYTGRKLYSNKQQIYVDINGIKPPNQYGKDVFIFYVDFNQNIVYPECFKSGIKAINNNCRKNGGGGSCCAAKIIFDDWQIKDDYPW